MFDKVLSNVNTKPFATILKIKPDAETIVVGTDSNVLLEDSRIPDLERRIAAIEEWIQQQRNTPFTEEECTYHIRSS